MSYEDKTLCLIVALAFFAVTIGAVMCGRESHRIIHNPIQEYAK